MFMLQVLRGTASTIKNSGPTHLFHNAVNDIKGVFAVRIGLNKSISLKEVLN